MFIDILRAGVCDGRFVSLCIKCILYFVHSNIFEEQRLIFCKYGTEELVDHDTEIGDEFGVVFDQLSDVCDKCEDTFGYSVDAYLGSWLLFVVNLVMNSATDRGTKLDGIGDVYDVLGDVDN